MLTTESLYRRKIAKIRANLPTLEQVIVLDEGGGPIEGTIDCESWMADASDAPPEISTTADDMALLHFTSGTTGTPKGAIHVHDAARTHFATGRYALDLHLQDIFWCTGALERIVQETQGYPYFLQEWGKHVWDVASRSPITVQDVEQATAIAIVALDKSFFRVRFDQLMPTERRYLRAMAGLGAGPHRSGDIATMLQRKVTALGPTRNQLISKGMIWSPSHGDTAFTVPMFDQFMVRIMTGDDWRTP